MKYKILLIFLNYLQKYSPCVHGIHSSLSFNDARIRDILYGNFILIV